jgi:hypothetical protein
MPNVSDCVEDRHEPIDPKHLCFRELRHEADSQMSQEQVKSDYGLFAGPPQYIKAARVVTDAQIVLGVLRNATSYTIPWSLRIPQFELHGHAI